MRLRTRLHWAGTVCSELPIIGLFCLPLICTAASAAPVDLSARLANLDLEDLAHIEITSVSKRESRLLNSPAAVAVVTAEEVRRLGATSIPEALRAVPGLQVARINANMWAISSRGFNDQYSNKLLVLIDGRTVYTPTFSGVYWDSEDVVLEDLDRIEVIRGPGSTLWGANAVNGVINIITKSARETQGTLVSTAWGTEDQPSVSARYGGTLATNLFYRVYVKYFDRDGFEDAAGNGMSDDWDLARGGVRLDWEPSDANTLTFQGDYYSGTRGEQVQKMAVFPATNAFLGVDAPHYGGNVLARWTQRFSPDSELKLQAYYSGYVRNHPWGGGSLVAGPDFAANALLKELRNTYDIEAQHHFMPRERHDVVWGAGFRHTADELRSNGTEIGFSPDERTDWLFNFFAQDEIALLPEKVRLTLGSKFEHNDVTGFEIQPGGRLAWTPTERQCVWASVARAVRTPSRLERDVRVNLSSFALPDSTPAQVSVFGNPNLESEELIAYEVGYRVEPTARLAFDLAGFYNDYDLASATTNASEFELTPAPPHLLYAPYSYKNGLRAHTYGLELRSQWRVADCWRLAGSYSWLNTSRSEDNKTLTHPEHQFHLQSTLELTHGLELHSAVYYMDRIRTVSLAPEPARIPAYVRLDVGITWAATPHLEFALWGQNLLDDGHPEFASYKTSPVAEIARAFYGKVTWRF